MNNASISKAIGDDEAPELFESEVAVQKQTPDLIPASKVSGEHLTKSSEIKTEHLQDIDLVLRKID